MMHDLNNQPSKRYTGTKTLRAWPMARGAYNEYRGWAAPEGEDQTTAGYLVEYEDGGKANDSRHAGYISWSPADVFEKAYHQIGTHQDRVLAENTDLQEKLMKLLSFFQTPAFDGLPEAERVRMRSQARFMDGYAAVLEERIAAFPA